MDLDLPPDLPKNIWIPKFPYRFTFLRCVSWWVSFQTVKGGGCNQYRLNHAQFCGTPILEPLSDHQKSCAFWLCGSSSNSQFLMSDPRSLLAKYLRERQFGHLGHFVLSFLKEGEICVEQSWHASTSSQLAFRMMLRGKILLILVAFIGATSLYRYRLNHPPSISI